MSTEHRYLIVAWIGVIALISLMFWIRPVFSRDLGQWVCS